MATEYYAEEITAVPFRIMARLLSHELPAAMAYPMAAFLRGRGLLRWPLKPTYAAGGLGSERTVQRNELPAQALSRWAAIAEQFYDLGFQPLKYALHDTIGNKEHAITTFLSSAGSTVASLEWILLRAETDEERVAYEFNSYAADDPDVMTAGMQEQDLALAELLTLDFVDTKCLSNKLPVRRVFDEHQARIQGRSFFHMAPEAALAEHEKRAERRFNWALEKGLMRRLRPKEVERLLEVRKGWDASNPYSDSLGDTRKLRM